MRPFRQVADLEPPHLGPNGERFAVIEIDPSQRVGTGCRAVVLSLHHERLTAEMIAQTGERGTA